MRRNAVGYTHTVPQEARVHHMVPNTHTNKQDTIHGAATTAADTLSEGRGGKRRERKHFEWKGRVSA
jgi:hypothetical protein